MIVVTGICIAAAAMMMYNRIVRCIMTDGRGDRCDIQISDAFN